MLYWSVFWSGYCLSIAYLSHSGKLPSCKCRALYWLLENFPLRVFAIGSLSPSSFEPSSLSTCLSSSLTGHSRRTLVFANALGHFLRSNPNWKRLRWMTAQTDSQNVYDISSAPLNSDGLERRSSGKATPGWIYSQTRDRRGAGARTANSLSRPYLAFWTNKDWHAPCATTFDSHPTLSALKKVWLPICQLNGSFQSPNCPLKGFFHSPNGIF